MSAMTWYDHETGSIWSQPWGRSIQGELKGVQLHLLPMQLTTWGNWKSQYPNTLAMGDDLDRLGERRQGFNPNFVIGLVLGEDAKAYHYSDAAQAAVINDWLGETPIALWVMDEIYQAYVRISGEQQLTFHAEGDMLVDAETGSIWDPIRGLAQDGPLRGKALQPVPSMSSFDWAWLDFYPETEFYKP